MGFRLLLVFSLSSALFIGAVLAGQLGPKSKRSGLSYSSRHGSRLRKTKESVDELALELAKMRLIDRITNEQHKVTTVKKSITTLERDSCTNIKSVGKPVTHNTQYHTQGDWMKDPLGIMGTEAIFVMSGYNGNNKLIEYASMDSFKAGVPVKKYTLPYNWDGTGAVVYGPNLYYNRAGTYYIVKYNLLTRRVEAQIRMSSYYTIRRNSYQWGGYSGMDLAVDEHGLWAISGRTTNGYRPYVTKIDVYTNNVIQSWTLSGVERMTHMGNAFMACGVFYAVDSYNGKTTSINYAFDTKTGRRWNPGLTFTNQYGYNSMIDYNPREKMLYAWDNKRQVTYSLTFEKP